MAFLARYSWSNTHTYRHPTLSPQSLLRLPDVRNSRKMFWSSSSPEWDIRKEIPNLEGKVVIVTGGNSGLGFATIQNLVRHGAKIYMGARNEERAKAAIARLDLGKGSKGSVEWLELDLSDPRRAKEACARFLEMEKRLDILVNNAAVTLVPYAKTNDDIQDVMVVNYLSPFVFTKTLVPLMRETAKFPDADVRIVNVSSVAIRALPDDIRFRNKEDFNDEHVGSHAQLKRYARSKLSNILFTKELQKKFDEEHTPILTLVVHPGTINTEGMRHLAQRQNWFFRPFYTWYNRLLPTAELGTYTQVFAAIAPIVREQADRYRGAFLMPPAVISNAGKPGESKELAKELWDTTETLLKDLEV